MIMERSTTPPSIPKFGILVDRTSFDETDDYGVDQDALQSSPWSKGKNEVGPKDRMVMKNGKVRRRLRWRPKSMMVKKKRHRSEVPALIDRKSSSSASVASTSNQTQTSKTSRRSVHSFASTETIQKSNRKGQKGGRRFPPPRPSYPSTFEGVTTIGNEGELIHARQISASGTDSQTLFAAADLEEEEATDAGIEINDDPILSKSPSEPARKPGLPPRATRAGDMQMIEPSAGRSKNGFPPLFRRRTKGFHLDFKDRGAASEEWSSVSETSTISENPVSTPSTDATSSTGRVSPLDPESSPLPVLSDEELEAERQVDLRIRAPAERREDQGSKRKGRSATPVSLPSRLSNDAVPLTVAELRQTFEAKIQSSSAVPSSVTPPDGAVRDSRLRLAQSEQSSKGEKADMHANVSENRSGLQTNRSALRSVNSKPGIPISYTSPVGGSAEHRQGSLKAAQSDPIMKYPASRPPVQTNRSSLRNVDSSPGVPVSYSTPDRTSSESSQQQSLKAAQTDAFVKYPGWPPVQTNRSALRNVDSSPGVPVSYSTPDWTGSESSRQQSLQAAQSDAFVTYPTQPSLQTNRSALRNVDSTPGVPLSYSTPDRTRRGSSQQRSLKTAQSAPSVEYSSDWKTRIPESRSSSPTSLDLSGSRSDSPAEESSREMRFSMSEHVHSRAALRSSENDSAASASPSPDERTPPSPPNNVRTPSKPQTGPVDVDDGSFLEAEKNLQAIHEMATEHLQHGEYTEALEVFEEILRGQLARYGPDHYRVGTALHNIGIVHLKRGDYTNAVRVSKEAVAVRKKALDSDHPDVAVSLAQLGVAYLESRKHKKAIIAFREALRIRRHCLGTQHPKVAKILNNIGCALYELNELEIAKVAFEEALTVQRSTLRDNDIEWGDSTDKALLSIACTLSNIGSIKLYRGQFDEASIDLEEALLIQQSVLGDDHPLPKRTRESLDFVEKGKSFDPDAPKSRGFLSSLSGLSNMSREGERELLLCSTPSSMSGGRESLVKFLPPDHFRPFEALEQRLAEFQSRLEFTCGSLGSDAISESESSEREL